MFNCMQRPNLRNVTLGTLGFGLFVRAVTNTEISRLMGITGERQAVDLQKTGQAPHEAAAQTRSELEPSS
jgi:hypothetical protein